MSFFFSNIQVLADTMKMTWLMANLMSKFMSDNDQPVNSPFE